MKYMMKNFSRYLRYLTFAQTFVIMFVVMFMMTVAAFSKVHAQNLPSTSTLTSNNIIALAGAGDTLWIETERGYNYRILSDENSAWNGFESNDFRLGLAFGGGGAAAVISELSNHSYNIWHFNHATKNQQRRNFRFSTSSDMSDSLAPFPVGRMIFSHGNFWIPFYTGGLVRYDPSANRAYAIRVGEDESQNFSVDTNTTNAVLSLDIMNIDDDTLILVTTPTAIMTYDPTNKNWQTLHDNQITLSPNQDINFISFNAAFVNKNGDDQTLYSFIDVYENGDTSTILYVYNDDENFARVSYNNFNTHERFTISPATNGAMFAMFGDSIPYRDVRLLAPSNNSNELQVIMQPNDFLNLLRDARDDIQNPRVNDILFLPQNENAGILAVATTTGLYLWQNAQPTANIDDYRDFTFVQHVREVRRGEAYALPSVIRSSSNNRYDRAVFVYRLRNDGNVTIRVFDYNMSPVKTIVRNEPRVARERSTDPARDFWDGTNEAGRRVSPGVYYFRISSTGGDRFTGRVILAK